MRMGIGMGLSRRGGGWTPASLFANGGDGVWAEPGDVSTVTQNSGNFVTGVSDKSGNGNDLYSYDSTLYPSIGAKLGGSQALVFEGTWNGPSPGDGPCQISDWVPTDEFWVAMTVQRGPQRFRSGSSLRPFFSCGSASSDEISFGTRETNDAADCTLAYSDGSAVTQTGSGTFNVGDRAHLVFQYSRGNYARLYRDGELIIDDTTNVAVVPNLVVFGGGRYSIARRTNCIIGEVIGGNGVLTSDDRALLTGYLTRRYDSGTEKTVIYEMAADTTYTDKSANQGVATSSDGFVFTCSTINSDSYFKVTTWNSDLSTSLQVYDTESDLPAAATQSNTLYFDEDTDKLYVGANNWNTEPAQGWILEYDVNTTTGALTFSARHDVGAYWNEGCTKYDGYFWTVYHNDHAIHQYDTDWTLVERHALPTSDPSDGTGEHLYQGIVFNDDIAYIIIHNGNARENAIFAYYWDGTEFSAVFSGIYPGTDVGQGIDFDGTHFWAASRVGGDATVASNVVKSTVSTSTIKVG